MPGWHAGSYCLIGHTQSRHLPKHEGQWLPGFSRHAALLGDTLDVKAHSQPTAGAVSQFRVPRLLIPPSQTAPLDLQAHPQVSVVLQYGPPTQRVAGVLPSLPYQVPLVKVLHLPSSQGPEKPGWGLRMQTPRPLGPPSDSAPPSFISREAVLPHVPGSTAPGPGG